MSESDEPFDPLKALDRGIAELKGSADENEVNRDYHEGRHPRLEWITKIKKVFGEDVADQVHQANYCELAIRKPLSRMKVEGFDNETATELFRANGLHLTQRDLYSDVLVIRDGFVILAESEEGSETPFDIVVQRSEDVYVEMGSLKPDDRVWAVKVSADPTLGDEGGYRAWVWDGTDRWAYVAPVGDPNDHPMPKASDFTEDPENAPGPHGFDGVPVIPFHLGREPKSRLDPLRPIQDRIDMLEIEKVVAGLFGASRQRVYFTTQELSEDDTESSPDFAIVLQPGNTEDGEARVDEFQHTPLDNFDGGIDAEIDRFYEIASLPKHARMNVAGGASGEAKKADDGDFVEMVRDYTEAFTESWRAVFALLGIEAEAKWKNPQTRDETAEITRVKTAVDAGVPLEFALTHFAEFDSDDLADFRKALAEQQARDAAAREDARRALDSGRDPAEVTGEFE